MKPLPFVPSEIKKLVESAIAHGWLTPPRPGSVKMGRPPANKKVTFDAPRPAQPASATAETKVYCPDCGCLRRSLSEPCRTCTRERRTAAARARGELPGGGVRL